MRSCNSADDDVQENDEDEVFRRVLAQATISGKSFFPIAPSLFSLLVKKQPNGKLLETASADDIFEG